MSGLLGGSCVCASGQQRRVLEEDLSSRGAFALQGHIRKQRESAGLRRKPASELLCSRALEQQQQQQQQQEQQELQQQEQEQQQQQLQQQQQQELQQQEQDQQQEQQQQEQQQQQQQKG
ncbi:uncharacterized protein EMH_0082170 [Eimeria mitis]|uniref:Uncharacterized protein n=1 Tax=Eimeria mitis TaxID=44415 RepID=U6K613_9EIME|nr:uncharacterized protein EMH_0082170 [Eimeria mitis]CDJ33374.1 hypothetical protein EMH_0082170 [Eimeria mitis]